MLIGFVGLGRGKLNALLSARVGILDLLSVRGGKLVEFVDAVTNRSGLPLHVFLAGKGIDLAPETLVGIGL